ncbi:thymidine kinase, partial [Streptomyces lasiicapitis]
AEVAALWARAPRPPPRPAPPGGAMVVVGGQVVVGDVNQAPDEVGYEVLCRRHHRRRMTAASARAGALSPDVLPVDTLERS